MELYSLNNRIFLILDTLVKSAAKQISNLIQESHAALCADVLQRKDEIQKLKCRLHVAEESPVSTIGIDHCYNAEEDDDFDEAVKEPDLVLKAALKDGQLKLLDTTSTPKKVLVLVMPDATKHKLVTTLSAGSKNTTAQNENFKRHITCLRLGESPKVERCTSCCSLYHCPFCQLSVYKPSEYHKIIPHIQSHLRVAVKHKEFVIYKCKLGCQQNDHYHCCYCNKFIIRKSSFVDHISVCQEKRQNKPLTPSQSTSPPPLFHSPLPVSNVPPIRPSNQDMDVQQSRPNDAPHTETQSTVIPFQCSREAPIQCSKMMCDFCGLILQKKNFKLHLKRRHRGELKDKEVKWQEKYKEGFEEKVLFQCHLCTVAVTWVNFRNHMRRKHKYQLSQDNWKKSLKKCVVEKCKKVRCQPCDILLYQHTLSDHMRIVHHEEIGNVSFQDNFLIQQGLMVTERCLSDSPNATGGDSLEVNVCQGALNFDIEMREEGKYEGEFQNSPVHGASHHKGAVSKERL